jgi:hypothetical protein
MSLVMPKETASEFELAPADTLAAVCYRIIDLGTQEIDWQGAKKHQHKIMISWELDAKMADGRPFSIHQRYTLSSSEKARLRKDLEAWRGVAFTDEDFGKFDLGKLIGVPCLIQVIHNSSGGKTYANISSLMRLPKGMTAPALVNESIYFSLNPFRKDLYEKLSDNLKETIAKSPEYQEAVKKAVPANNNQPTYDEDDIPFPHE